MRSNTQPVDWAAVGSSYANSVASIREIARSHGVSDTAIRKRAKAGGWTRNAIDRPVAPIPASQWPVKSRAGKSPSTRKMRLPGDAPDDGHFVYVIHEAGEGLACKVGVSADPRSRLLQLQCATWRRLVLAAAFLTADSNEAHYLERAVHQSLQGLHLTGEWFSVGAARAISEIRASATAGGVTIKAAKIVDRQ